MKKRPGSLRTGLVTTIVLCWLLPIVIVMTMAAVLLGDSYQTSAQQQIDTGAENALRQIDMRMESAIKSSKAVSYDGVVRAAYREYENTGDKAQLYRSVNDYLKQSFARDEKIKAAFIGFWDESVGVWPYLIEDGTTSYSVLRTYRDNAQKAQEALAEVDTGICFFVMDGEIYMARNLLDSRFQPYASLVMMLDAKVIFLPMEVLSQVSDICVTLDDCCFRPLGDGILETLDRVERPGEMHYSVDIDGHDFSFTAVAERFSIWDQTPWLRWAVIAVVMLVLPLLALVVFLFYRHVADPIDVLAEANQRVQAGERGYEITETPPNTEFLKLYHHFNEMSTELSSQFERSILEQQATQQAKIKALQSQINPHFLNNTLEVINWEARIAENDRVCAMIEALSTMLDATLDRDGRSQIPLREELVYVDAYLYIIRQRLGDGLRVSKDILDAVTEQMIPRLILQPLVENAVEHDLTPSHGGSLDIRAYRQSGFMFLEVEHDGVMTEEDKEKVQALLSAPTTGRLPSVQVGVRNVNQRLKLMYGEKGSLIIRETGHGRILARVQFPI